MAEVVSLADNNGFSLDVERVGGLKGVWSIILDGYDITTISTVHIFAFYIYFISHLVFYLFFSNVNISCSKGSEMVLLS